MNGQTSPIGGGGGGGGAPGAPGTSAGTSLREVEYPYLTGMGKGLREPCSPYREAYVFGAELGAPDASNWNCPPVIVDPTTSFDLSTITPNHEVVVASVDIGALPGEETWWVYLRWYRDRDGALLYETAYYIPFLGEQTVWPWVYAYSYIGYVPGKIEENGSYHVDIWLDQSLLQRINFTVTGIPAVAIAGEISWVWMWYEPLPAWERVWSGEGWPAPTLGPEIPLNSWIYLAPVCSNRSGVSIVLHADLEVTYPDGTKQTLSAYIYQDEEATPGEGWAIQFMPFISSQVGTYSVVATLSSAGQVLDTATFELVAAPIEVYEGAISKMELEYDEARAPIPAYDISQGQRGLVHIWGRNNMTTTQQMGITWLVTDPDGAVVEEYSAWELWPYTSPGDDHEFIGGRFNLDKLGGYTINVALYMNPDNPEIVSTYYGILCTVAAVVPEPEFRGFGVTEYITV